MTPRRHANIQSRIQTYVSEYNVQLQALFKDIAAAPGANPKALGASCAKTSNMGTLRVLAARRARLLRKRLRMLKKMAQKTVLEVKSETIPSPAQKASKRMNCLRKKLQILKTKSRMSVLSRSPKTLANDAETKSDSEKPASPASDAVPQSSRSAASPASDVVAKSSRSTPKILRPVTKARKPKTKTTSKAQPKPSRVAPKKPSALRKSLPCPKERVKTYFCRIKESKSKRRSTNSKRTKTAHRVTNLVTAHRVSRDEKNKRDDKSKRHEKRKRDDKSKQDDKSKRHDKSKRDEKSKRDDKSKQDEKSKQSGKNKRNGKSKQDDKSKRDDKSTRVSHLKSQIIKNRKSSTQVKRKLLTVPFKSRLCVGKKKRSMEK